MMRIRTAAIWASFAGFFALPVAVASAQTPPPPPPPRAALASPPPAGGMPAQRRISRLPNRLRVYPNDQPDPDGVYPRYYPGRNAVRSCSVRYVQEFRPSGTVITPHMNCFWRPG